MNHESKPDQKRAEKTNIYAESSGISGLDGLTRSKHSIQQGHRKKEYMLSDEIFISNSKRVNCVIVRCYY